MSAASGSTAPVPLTPSIVLFARGVIARLSIWTALRVAIQDNGDRAEKTTLFASEIVDAFQKEDPLPDAVYIEELLLQIMEDELETLVEDDSAEGVAKDILRLWEEGTEEMVVGFEAQAEKVKGKVLDVQEDSETDESCDEDDEDGDVPMLVDPAPQRLESLREEPEVDEDGFTTVKRHGRR